MTLLQAEGEELADDRLVRAPFQHLTGKEENKGDRQHIADDGDDVNAPQGQTQAYAYRNRTAQPSSGTMEIKKAYRYFVSIVKPHSVKSCLYRTGSIIQDNGTFGKQKTTQLHRLLLVAMPKNWGILVFFEGYGIIINTAFCHISRFYGGPPPEGKAIF